MKEELEHHESNTNEKAKAPILPSEHFKASGMDVIYPTIKEGVQYLEQFLINICLACLTLGYVPTHSQQVKIVFIPKIGKDDYSNVNFRQIR